MNLEKTRKQTLQNVQILIDHAAVTGKPLNAAIVMNLLHVSIDAARRYLRDMVGTGNLMALTPANVNDPVEYVLINILAPKRIDKKALRMIPKINITGERQVISTTAKQVGMKRHWLDIAFFGEPKVSA